VIKVNGFHLTNLLELDYDSAPPVNRLISLDFQVLSTQLSISSISIQNKSETTFRWESTFYIKEFRQIFATWNGT